MNTGAMNMAQMARAINNIKTFPIVTARTFGTRANGQGLEQIQNGPVGYTPVQQPVMLLPYGGYVPSSYMYVSQPVYYGLPQPVATFSTFTPNTSRNYKRHGSPFNGQSVPQYSYSTGSETESVEDDAAHAYDNMTAMELYNIIKTHLTQFSRAKLSWLNKLFTKVITPEEFLRALEIFDTFHRRLISITPETGTLLIKAACRAGEPEKALALLKAIDRVRIWPTLGGIHYLMINFSLKKDTASVKQAFEIAKIRDLKPTVRTYQILIRECVDNGLIDDALHYMSEAEAAKVEPNRVTYNILMNGLRMAGKANEILALRRKMDEHKLEINDTTVKFTTLAYVMLQDLQSAVKEFKSYDYQDKFEAFCKKFFEVTDEPDATQKKCVVDLFESLQSEGIKLPEPITSKLSEVKSSL